MRPASQSYAVEREARKLVRKARQSDEGLGAPPTPSIRQASLAKSLDIALEDGLVAIRGALAPYADLKSGMEAPKFTRRDFSLAHHSEMGEIRREHSWPSDGWCMRLTVAITSSACPNVS